MQNFTYQNPVKIVFGKGAITELATLLPAGGKTLLAYGGGSIKKNGVYDQVKAALKGHACLEFSGIEPNPRYETLMRAVELCRKEKIGFLLAVGGGSVLDGTKFIAAAVPFSAGDPWEILSKNAPVGAALPLGSVLTLPATGSETNTFAVISRESAKEKLAFSSPLVYPQFAILDPETTYTLPERQTTNGIVDAWVHVLEQYLTFDVNAPLQARQAEAILLTLREEGPKALKNGRDYAARANVMWCATQALSGLIAVGVPQDWSTHMIGHELTAAYGIDHAQSLAVVLPGLLRRQQGKKLDRLVQYGERVFGIREGTPAERAEKAVAQTEAFFRSLGMKTRLGEYGVPADCPEVISARFKGRKALGEHGDIDPKEIMATLRTRA